MYISQYSERHWARAWALREISGIDALQSTWLDYENVLSLCSLALPHRHRHRHRRRERQRRRSFPVVSMSLWSRYKCRGVRNKKYASLRHSLNWITLVYLTSVDWLIIILSHRTQFRQWYTMTRPLMHKTSMSETTLLLDSKNFW